MTENVSVLVHSGREVIYNLFYRAFIDSPKEDLYAMLEELVPRLGEFGEDKLQEGVDRLKSLLQERSAAEKTDEFDLDMRRDYTRILCLTDSAPGMESYYVSPERLAMQEARDEVLGYYSEFEMKKSAVYKEYEDFIANEMHFMSYMAKLTTEAELANDRARIEELVRAQYNFLKEHPLRWIPQFTAKVNAYKEAERIYGPLAVIMSEFIIGDASFLEELLG